MGAILSFISLFNSEDDYKVRKAVERDLHLIASHTSWSVEELREANGIYRVLTPDQAIEHIRTAGVWVTHPLCGGIPPELAWPSLELLANEVLPQIHNNPSGNPAE